MRIIPLIILSLISATGVKAQTMNTNQVKQIAVWDTYVERKDGRIMHFDILVPAELKDTGRIFGYGREYLKKKGQEGQTLTAKECRFCHVEAVRPHWEKDIQRQGYSIIEMENCED